MSTGLPWFTWPLQFTQAFLAALPKGAPDYLALLVEELEARDPARADDKRVAQFSALQAEIEHIKVKAAERRLARIAADLEALRGADEQAYGRLKARLRELVRD